MFSNFFRANPGPRFWLEPQGRISLSRIGHPTAASAREAAFEEYLSDLKHGGFTPRDIVRVDESGRSVVSHVTEAQLAKERAKRLADRKNCKRCGGYGMPQFVNVNGGYCARCGAAPKIVRDL